MITDQSLESKFLITSKVDLNFLAQDRPLETFEKIFFICSPEEEEAERAKYESVYHLYKDGITLYSGEFVYLVNLISKRLYQENPLTQVYLIPRYIILNKVTHWRITRALRTFDKVFIICSPKNEDRERRVFEDVYKSLDVESKDRVTLYSGERKLLLAHIKHKMIIPC